MNKLPVKYYINTTTILCLRLLSKSRIKKLLLKVPVSMKEWINHKKVYKFEQTIKSMN